MTMLTRIMRTAVAAVATGPIILAGGAEAASLARPAFNPVTISVPVTRPSAPLPTVHTNTGTHLGEIAARKTPLRFGGGNGTSGHRRAPQDGPKPTNTETTGGTTGQAAGDDKKQVEPTKPPVKADEIIIKNADGSYTTVTKHTDPATGMVTTTEKKGEGPPTKTTYDPRNSTTTVEKPDGNGGKTIITTETDAKTGITNTFTQRADGSTTLVFSGKDKKGFFEKTTDAKSVTTTRYNAGGSLVYVQTDKDGKVTQVLDFPPGNGTKFDSTDSDSHLGTVQSSKTEISYDIKDPKTGARTTTSITVPSGVRIVMKYDANGQFVSEETYDPATGITTVVTEGRM
jgi:hypothetical protein